jgi:hypothetical protein
MKDVINEVKRFRGKIELSTRQPVHNRPKISRYFEKNALFLCLANIAEGYFHSLTGLVFDGGLSNHTRFRVSARPKSVFCLYTAS